MDKSQIRSLLLFDLDDTLVDTSDLYWKTKSSFIELIASIVKVDVAYSVNYNFSDLDYLGKLFEEIDGKNMQRAGINPSRYKMTMMDMYTYFVDSKIVNYSDSVVKMIDTIGNRIFTTVPAIIPGALTMLEKLKSANKYKLVLVTRGIEEVQEKKIKYYKLDSFFEKQYIVSSKSGTLYRQIIEQFDISLDNSWIIGDSIKSEINPALEIGANCILYKYHHHSYSWLQEHSEVANKDNFLTVNNLMEIPSLLDHYMRKFL